VGTGSRQRVGAWLSIVAAFGIVIGTFLPWAQPLGRSRTGWQLINDHHEPYRASGETRFTDICEFLTCEEINFTYETSGTLITGAWALLDAAVLLATILLCTGIPHRAGWLRRVPSLKSGPARVMARVSWGLLALSTVFVLASFDVASDVGDGQIGGGLLLLGVSMVIALVGLPMAMPARVERPERVPRPRPPMMG